MQVFKDFLWLVLLATVAVTPGSAQTTNFPPANATAPPSAPPGNATAPPSAPPATSEAELEKLVAPIALYPDPLLAILLPASAYPIEIVQAARFIKDTNNIANLDSQPWDENVKALARFPDVISKMDADIGWASKLGQAFVDDQKAVMDAIQVLRGKANKAGSLKTTPQQVITTTNEVVQKTVEQQVVYVTNTVVQIQPAQSQVIYVPQYNPSVVYAPPPSYVYDPVAPLVTFGVGMAVGAAIFNDCDWHSGGVYVGHHGAVAWGGGHGDMDVDVNRNVNVNRSANVNQTVNASGAAGQKWQPDPNRRTSTSTAATPEARGWGGQASQNASAARAQASQNASAARSQASQNASAARSQASQNASEARSQASQNASAARSQASQNASAARAQASERASAARSQADSRASAFNSSGGAAQARTASARGSGSRGGGGGGFRGGGGGGRGGGGRR